MDILFLTTAYFQRFDSLMTNRITQYPYLNQPTEIKYITMSAKHGGTQTRVLNRLGSN